MDWIRQGAVDACAPRARHLVSVIVATAGVVVLAAACVACSQATPSAGSSQAAVVPSPDIVTSSARGSHVATASPNVATTSPNSVNSNAGGSSRSGCPTGGIGGDSLAPVCVTPTTSSARGVQGPITPSATPPLAPSAEQNQPTSPAASPRVTEIFPASGGTVGGKSITITGSGFTGATEVEFGGVTAQMTVDSDTEITAISPPGRGRVDVIVVTPNGTSATSPADQFTYLG
jgi:IPT/TIG domain